MAVKSFKRSTIKTLRSYRNFSVGNLGRPIVTGGTLTSDATYYYRTFTGNGSLGISGASLVADVLIVAGGGSGGAGTGGGGGAGGLISISSYPFSSSTYEVTVGSGGTNDDVGTGTSGSNTVVSNGTATLTALGGGAGGATETNNVTFASSNGGSGGGGQNYYPSNGNTAAGSATQPSTTSDGLNSYASTGFGNAGSSGVSSGSGGGGGGAGAAATSGSPNGGAGKQLDISGTLAWYAAGGSGGNGGTTSTNGIGGRHVAPNGTAGSVNTGSGGGGGWDHAGGTGGAGGSGIVIVRYTRTQVDIPIPINYLVIGGGGGGGRDNFSENRGAGGGGAGGYRASVGTSGGGAAAESALSLFATTNYTVTVGAGGRGGTTTNDVAGVSGASGSNSVFATITSIGGGGGGGHGSNFGAVGLAGGSSGGAGNCQSSTGAPTANQGFSGGRDLGCNSPYHGFGGGGAGAAAANSSSASTAGGDGVASSITGTSVTRAAGGGGRGGSNTAAGGTGGGGAGTGVSGTVNTGSGGGGNRGGDGGAGGSGVVIISYPQEYDIRNGAGLTYTTSVVGSNKVTTFTAGTGDIQFAAAVNSSFVLLETVTLTSAQASVEFANLAAKYGTDYQHLQLRVVARTTRADVGDDIILRFNNDSTAGNYQYHALYGTGSAAGSENAQSASGARFMQATSANFTGSAFNAGVCDILDPFETTKNKTIRTLSGVPGSYNRIWLASNLWANTSAVTSITLVSGFSASFVAGTRISIYGLKGS